MRGPMIALLLLGSSVPAAFVPPPNQAGESAWIPLRHQHQEAHLCVPTSASMILEYFGDPISPREIKALSRGKAYVSDAEFADFTITMWTELVAGLARRGYRWSTTSYDNDDRGFMAGLADMTRSLDDGVPVMIDCSYRKSPHTFVIAGYSMRQRAVFAVDPLLDAPGIRTIGFSDLAGIWTSRAVGTDRRALLIPRRRSEKERP